jgi:hypothetical protein
VAEDQAGWRRGAATDHVLIRPADVRRNDLEDDAMLDLLAVARVHQFREVNRLDLHLATLDVSDAAIRCHDGFPNCV